MTTTIYRNEDPTLDSVEFGAGYRIRVDDEETPTDSYALLYRFVWPN